MKEKFEVTVKRKFTDLTIDELSKFLEGIQDGFDVRYKYGTCFDVYGLPTGKYWVSIEGMGITHDINDIPKTAGVIADNVINGEHVEMEGLR